MDVGEAMVRLRVLIRFYEEILKEDFSTTGQQQYRMYKANRDALCVARDALEKMWVRTQERLPLLHSNMCNLGVYNAMSDEVLCCDTDGYCCVGVCQAKDGRIFWTDSSDGKDFECIAWMELPDTKEIVGAV